MTATHQSAPSGDDHAADLATMSGPVSRRQVIKLGALAGAAGATATLLPTAAHAAAVTASSFLPAHGNDHTAALQAALNSSASEVTIDSPGAGNTWVTGPLTLPSNKTLTISNGVTISAKAGYGATECLLRGDKIANLTIVGYGARLVLPYVSTYSGEQRHVIRLASSSNITIKGVEIENPNGGDGIYLGNANQSGVNAFNYDVKIIDVRTTKIHRNCISVISALTLLIDGCTLKGASGTSPKAGIDLEPNLPGERLFGVRIENCRFEDNIGSNLCIVPRNLKGSTSAVDIRILNCHLGKQAQVASGTPARVANLVFDGTGGAPAVTLHVKNTFINTADATPTTNDKVRTGVIDIVASPGTLPESIVLDNVVGWVWTDKFVEYRPVGFRPSFSSSAPTHTAQFGGTKFYQVTLYAGALVNVSSSSAQPVVNAFPCHSSDTCTGLSGKVTICGPNGAASGVGGTGLAVDHQTASVPTIDVTSNATGFTFTRTPALPYATAARYDVGGTALAGPNYKPLTGHVIFPPGSTSVTVPVVKRVGPGTVTVKLSPATGIVAGATLATHAL